MINQLLLVGCSIFIYEFLRYVKLKHILKSNLKSYKKILILFSLKNILDSKKEKLLFKYSKKLFLTSIIILIILLLMMVIIFIIGLLSESFLNLIFSIFGIIELSLLITFYHLVRKKIDSKL